MQFGSKRDREVARERVVIVFMLLSVRKGGFATVESRRLAQSANRFWLLGRELGRSQIGRNQMSWNGKFEWNRLAIADSSDR